MNPAWSAALTLTKSSVLCVPMMSNEMFIFCWQQIFPICQLCFPTKTFGRPAVLKPIGKCIVSDNLIISFRSAILSSGFCQSNGIDVFQSAHNQTFQSKNISSQYVNHQLVKFYTTIYGTSRIIALCNIIAIENVS